MLILHLSLTRLTQRYGASSKVVGSFVMTLFHKVFVRQNEYKGTFFEQTNERFQLLSLYVTRCYKRSLFFLYSHQCLAKM